jgi:lipopolysaccharide export system ATP-binding protein
VRGAGVDAGGWALEVREARVILGRRAVLSGVSLGVGRGEVVGLIGPNGAGKSTLLRAVVGLQPLGGGEVALGGVVLAGGQGLAQRARMGLGFVPQGSCTLRGLTVWENLKAVPGLSDARAQQALEAIGLKDRAQALGQTLSGGERRRLEVGRALMLPGLVALLCDEPFAALDPLGVQAVAALLRQAARVGVGVLVTDHHVEALLALCDRVVVLVDGRAREVCEGEGEGGGLKGGWLARYLGGG